MFVEQSDMTQTSYMWWYIWWETVEKHTNVLSVWSIRWSRLMINLLRINNHNFHINQSYKRNLYSFKFLLCFYWSSSIDYIKWYKYQPYCFGTKTLFNRSRSLTPMSQTQTMLELQQELVELAEHLNELFFAQQPVLAK